MLDELCARSGGDMWVSVPSFGIDGHKEIGRFRLSMDAEQVEGGVW